MVALPTPVIEAQLDDGYDVATRRTVRCCCPTARRSPATSWSIGRPGRDRLSDYAHIDERFRYRRVAGSHGS